MERIDLLKTNEHKFWPRVKKDNPDLCWSWMKYKDKNGYGDFQFCYLGIKYRYRAHRTSYELTKGVIPNDLIVCHKCDNPTCVNPNHLFTGTHQDNCDDKINKGRQAIAEINGRSKLNWLLVNEIRCKYESGFSIKELSGNYNISTDQIINIIKNDSWIDENYVGVSVESSVFGKGHTFSRVIPDEKVIEIKILINKGLKNKEISEITGVKNQKIKDIKRGVAYFNIKL